MPPILELTFSAGALKIFPLTRHFQGGIGMKRRCPFCHTEMEIPETLDASGFCRCGAFGQISLVKEAHHFTERARKALGVEVSRRERGIEIVDGGTVFEAQGEFAIIQWAKKPYSNSERS